MRQACYRFPRLLGSTYHKVGGATVPAALAFVDWHEGQVFPCVETIAMVSTGAVVFLELPGPDAAASFRASTPLREPSKLSVITKGTGAAGEGFTLPIFDIVIARAGRRHPGTDPACFDMSIRVHDIVNRAPLRDAHRADGDDWESVVESVFNLAATDASGPGWWDGEAILRVSCPYSAQGAGVRILGLGWRY